MATGGECKTSQLVGSVARTELQQGRGVEERLTWLVGGVSFGNSGPTMRPIKELVRENVAIGRQTGAEPSSPCCRP